MTQHPFHHSDADRLNTLLDALVSRKRAPDAAASDLDAYAATHRLVSGDAAADASATPSDATLDDIWRNIMQVPATVPASTEGFRTPISARQKARLNAVPAQPRPSRFQSLASIAAVAAMLMVLVATAWFSGGRNGPENPVPGRYAAVPLEPGTPVSEAFTVEPWMLPIDPSECTAEPMTSAEYADKVRRSPEPPERSYDITGEPDSATAQDAVAVAREYNACDLLMDAKRTRSLSTARFLNPSTLFWAAPDSDYPTDWRTSPESEFIAHFSYALPPSAWALIFDEGAPDYVQEVWDRNVLAQSTPVVPPVDMEDEDRRYVHDMPYGIPAYNPAQAQMLADGRVAVPMTRMYWWDDPNLDSAADVFESPDQRLIVILSDIEGEWMVDEWAYLCFGECELPPTASAARPEASPNATPESVGWTAAAPLSDDAWMEPIRREDCEAEPMPTGEYVDIIRSDIDISGRSYEMTGPPPPERVADVIPVLRHYSACVITAPPPFTDHDDTAARSLSTDAYLQENGNPLSEDSAAEHREGSADLDELEAYFRSLPRSAYITVLDTEAPPIVQEAWDRDHAPADTGGDEDQALIHNHALPLGAIVYNPALAVQLADGRMAVPQSLIIWQDDPNFPSLDFWTGVPVTLYVLTEEDGQWLVDEKIEVCVGDCGVPADLAATPEGTSPTPATPDDSDPSLNSSDMDGRAHVSVVWARR